MPKRQRAGARRETSECTRTFSKANDILEISIPFRITRIGALSKQANVHGTFRIHGKDHEMTMVVEAVPAGNRLDLKRNS